MKLHFENEHLTVNVVSDKDAELTFSGEIPKDMVPVVASLKGLVNLQALTDTFALMGKAVFQGLDLQNAVSDYEVSNDSDPDAVNAKYHETLASLLLHKIVNKEISLDDVLGAFKVCGYTSEEIGKMLASSIDAVFNDEE